MSQYIVSARKYRPDSFETLIGQDVIARTLKNSIARGKIAHAYLFCGPRGVGKTSTARIFAKAINCSDPTDDLEPCGKCESCVSFQEGRSFCIHELDAASNNGVEDIKALLEKVQIPPQVGKYSVYIIDEVHMLSQAAFNAFLKTLEEPPAHAVFILATTEKHKIIPTILSRCQTYDFNRITVSDIVRNLRAIADKESIRIDDESLHIIAQKADGAMRDALTIFDQTVAFCGTDIRYEDVLRNLNVLDYEYTFKLVDCFLAGDYASAMLTFDEVLAKGFNALHFVLALSSHFRDLLVSRTAGLDSLLDLPASLKERYAAQASGCSIKFLYDALDITTQCEAGYKASVNPRLHIEFALMKLSFLRGMPAEAPVKPVVKTSVQERPAAAPKPAEPAVKPVAAVAAKPVAEKPAAPAVEPVPDVKPAPVKAAASVAVPEPEKAVEPVEIEIDGIELSADFAEISLDDDFVSPAGPSAAETPAETPAVSAPVEPEKPAQAAPAEPETPLQSAPAVDEPAIQPTPRARRKVAAGAASLSLSSVIEEEKREAEAADALLSAGRLPEDEEILSHWQDLVDQNASRPRLANALANAKLSVEPEGEGKLLTFTVTNEAQKSWIETNLLNSLEGAMCKILKCGKIRLAVAAAQYVEEEKIYMPEDQARDLIGRHQEVKELVIDLGLDIK